jgi:hypothetical protein
MSSFENLTWFWENYKIRRSTALHFLHCMLYVFSLLIYVLDGDDYCVKVIEIDSIPPLSRWRRTFMLLLNQDDDDESDEL